MVINSETFDQDMYDCANWQLLLALRGVEELAPIV